MDNQPTEQKTQTISDDQELAKVLAGVNTTDDNANNGATDVPVPTPPVPSPDPAADPAAEPADGNVEVDQPDSPELPPMPEVPQMPDQDMGAGMDSVLPSDLESIKQEALGELRPLVDKLDVSPEEKFDTYLLLLRSTDDRDLIAPAHAAAKNIVDEARKAQALLDIIKEIDFLSKPQQ